MPSPPAGAALLALALCALLEDGEPRAGGGSVPPGVPALLGGPVRAPLAGGVGLRGVPEGARGLPGGWLRGGGHCRTAWPCSCAGGYPLQLPGLPSP